MSNPSDIRARHAIQVPTPEEDASITAAALADPDAQPLTDDQLRAMVPLRSLRGRPPLTTRKELVSIRYSPEVVSFFKATGAGWQARMDSVLKAYVRQQQDLAPQDR